MASKFGFRTISFRISNKLIIGLLRIGAVSGGGIMGGQCPGAWGSEGGGSEEVSSWTLLGMKVECTVRIKERYIHSRKILKNNHKSER